MSKLTGQIEAAKSKMFDITKLCSKHREYRRAAVASLDSALAEAAELEECLEEIEKVSCGEEQIESDGAYDDSDGMKWIYDRIQALKESKE